MPSDNALCVLGRFNVSVAQRPQADLSSNKLSLGWSVVVDSDALRCLCEILVVQNVNKFCTSQMI